MLLSNLTERFITPSVRQPRVIAFRHLITEALQQCILPRNHDKATDGGENQVQEANPLVRKYSRDREDCEYMWSMWDLAIKYTIVKYLSSNRPTELYPRDLHHWFSENDCLRFLRFTRAQARLQVLLRDTPPLSLKKNQHAPIPSDHPPVRRNFYP